MNKFIGFVALAVISCSACAITAEDLATHSWMPPETDEASSCELPPMISFHKDGTLSGEPGCNFISGNYTIDADGKIDLSRMALTQKMCAKEYMDQEQKFMAMLNQTQYIKKTDDLLILMNKDKQEIGRLVPEKSKACN